MTDKINVEILSPGKPAVSYDCDRVVYHSLNSINDLLGENIAELASRLNNLQIQLPINENEANRVVLEPNSHSAFAFLEKGKSVEIIKDKQSKVIKLQSDGFLFSEKTEKGNSIVLFVNNYIPE